MKGNKAIVSSGFGFIGSRLIQALVDDNDVTIVDTGSVGKLENLSGHWIDLRKIKKLLRIPIIVGGGRFLTRRPPRNVDSYIGMSVPTTCNEGVTSSPPERAESYGVTRADNVNGRVVDQ
jgi:hypothetical protein